MKKLIIFVLTLFLLVGYYLLFTTKTHAQQVNYIDFIANIESIDVVDSQSSLIVGGSDALNSWMLYNINENKPNEMTISESWYKYLENIIGSSVRTTDKTEIYFKNYLLTNDYTIIFNFNDPSQVGPYPNLYIYIYYDDGTNSTIQTSVNLTNSYAIDYTYFTNNNKLNKRIKSIAYTSEYFTSIQLFSPQNPYNYDIGYDNGKNEILNNPQRFGLYPIEYLQAQYQKGFEDGLSEDNSRVYDVGYDNGYYDGVYDTQIEGVANVVNFNQLYNYTSSTAINGITFIYDDYSYILNNTSTSSVYKTTNLTFINGNKYLFKLENFSNTRVYLTNQDTSGVFGSDFMLYQSAILTALNNGGDIRITIPSNRTFNNYKIRLNVFNLTQIYGSGNEPETIEQFEIDFPSEYYPYTTTDLVNIDYERGYIIGEKQGFITGYEKGKDVQATEQLTSSGWIQSIFTGFQSFFNLQIFPGVSIGLIIGVPFVISLAYFVIRAFRGGGSA